jgi:hypothetical protein
MPGRVGLVAIDALALGLPVHTTDFGFHAPEIEFLQPGELEYLPDNPTQYSLESLSLITQRRKWPERPLRNDIPSVQHVAAAMYAIVRRVSGTD